MNQDRSEIEKIDREIIALLARRMKHAQNIITIKQQKGHALRDDEREAKLREIHAQAAQKLGLNPSLIEDLFERIFQENRG